MNNCYLCSGSEGIKEYEINDDKYSICKHCRKDYFYKDIVEMVTLRKEAADAMEICYLCAENKAFLSVECDGSDYKVCSMCSTERYSSEAHPVAVLENLQMDIHARTTELRKAGQIYSPNA